MCNVTHPFETKNVGLEVKNGLNGAFVCTCHSLPMSCYFCDGSFDSGSYVTQCPAEDVWILDYMLQFVSVELFWHINGSL